METVGLRIKKIREGIEELKKLMQEMEKEIKATWFLLRITALVVVLVVAFIFLLIL